MNADVEACVRSRMARGEETLEDARLVLERGHLHGEGYRLYCACVYVDYAAKNPLHTQAGA